MSKVWATQAGFPSLFPAATVVHLDGPDLVDELVGIHRFKIDLGPVGDAANLVQKARRPTLYGRLEIRFLQERSDKHLRRDFIVRFQVILPAPDQLLDLRLECLAVDLAHLVGRSREIDDPQLRGRTGR
jgi:GTP1/Obg family GTP-binding protein